MKHKIHGLLIGVTLILVLSFCFSLSAFAEGGADGAVPKEPDVEVVEGSDRYGAELTVYSESVSLEYSAGRMYYLSVYASGSVNFASYEMYLMLPEFMEIKNVFYKGNSEEVFVYNIEGDNILKVTYSSTYDRSYAQLFEIEFELSKESIGAIGYPMFTSGAIFTNTNFETFYASSSFGEVKVTSGGPLKGDFNLDGVVTLEDVILIQRAIVGLEDYSEASFYAADIDRNGSVNIVDVQYIRMYLIKAIDSLEELQPTDRFTFRVLVMSKGGSYRGESIFYGNPQMTYRQLFDSVFNSLSGEYSMLDYESAYTDSGMSPYSDEYLSNNDTIYIRENIYSTNIVIRFQEGYETMIPMGGDEEKTYASMFGYMREYLEELVKMGKFGELDYENAYTQSGESVFDETKHLYRDDVIYISEKAITFTDDEIRTQIYVIGNPTIYQNSDREAVLDALVGREIMMEQYAEKNGRRYYISNEEIEITADMIGDLSKVDLSKIDNYVSFPIVIDGETFTINVNIIPDLSNAKVRYQVVRVTESRYYNDDGSYYTKPYYYYAELFDNGVMRTCPFDERQNENPWYNYAEYTTETYGNDQIVVITGDGMEGCYVITRETTYQGYPIIEDYQPSEEADVVSYSLMLGKQMIRLDVFNENYAMLYENMNNNGEMRFESTIKVSIDAENHTLTFMGSTYQIGEGNFLSIPLPEGDPTETVYYLGNEVVFLLYENNVGVYTMNGAVATTVEWKYDTDSDGIEILIVNIYGTELTFYKWNIDGQWHQNTEPNFEKATVQSLIYGEETWLLYTFSEYSSCYLKTADSPALIQGYYYGNAVTVYGPMGDLKLRIIDGELVPMEDDDEPIIDDEPEDEETVSVIIKEMMGGECTYNETLSAPVGMTVYEALKFDSSVIGTTETEEQEDGTVVIYTLAGLFRDPTGREEYTEKDVVEDRMVIYILYTIASYTETF